VVREVEDSDVRAKALSEMLARLLCGWCGVDAFREQALAGKLLSVEELPRWIEEQAAREGPVAGHYLTIPAPIREPHGWLLTGDVAAYADWLSERAKRVAEDPKSELPLARTQGPVVLEYGVPPQGGGVIAIRSDGILALLKSVVSGTKGLCGYTGWSERSAVAFVLCGRIPSPRRASVVVRSGGYAAATEIELAVSANMSPTEVAALYQDVRVRERGAPERAMDARHLALALFVDEARESGLGWKELRRLWNKKHPGWRFKTATDPHARRFADEARRCWSRVTGEKWRDLRDARPVGAD
jgi:hypothetical protein